MTKTEQNRVLAWRLKLLRESALEPRSVAQTCRRFGLSRQSFYKWKSRYELHGEAGLCDRPRIPHRDLYVGSARLRQEGPLHKIAGVGYLRRFLLARPQDGKGG
jgi:hypothetical protein